MDTQDASQHEADAGHDPITAALLAAVQAHRTSGSDAAVLAALRQAADYCRTRLEEVLDKAIREAEEARQRFAVVRAGDDEAEKTRRFLEGEMAMRHAEAVARHVEQTLLDFAPGIVELTGPALARLQHAVSATQRLVEEAESRTQQSDPSSGDR